MKVGNLAKSLEKYYSLSSSEVKDVQNKVEADWKILCKEFNNLCQQDDKLVSLKKEIEQIDSIIYFDTKANFKTYSYTANEGLGTEFEEEVYEFNKKDYKEIMRTLETFKEKEAKISEKIEKLKKSNRLFSRNDR